jgi:hypothetical protein
LHVGKKSQTAAAFLVLMLGKGTPHRAMDGFGAGRVVAGMAVPFSRTFTIS